MNRLVALICAAVLFGCGSPTGPGEAGPDTVTITTTVTHSWTDYADGTPPDTVVARILDAINSGGAIQYAFGFETVSGDTLTRNGTWYEGPSFGFAVQYMEQTDGWIKTWIDDEFLSEDSTTYYVVHADTTYSEWASPLLNAGIYTSVERAPGQVLDKLEVLDVLVRR
jgi:hypothetical protein